MRPPPLVLTLAYLPPKLATADDRAAAWVEFRGSLLRFVATGRASLLRAGVPLDVATVAVLEAEELIGLVAMVHDRALAHRILTTARQVDP